MTNKYAVVRSHFRPEYKPMKGCYLVVKETDSFVFVEMKNKDGEVWQEKFKKTNVVFYATKDVSREVESVNNAILKACIDHSNWASAQVVALIRNCAEADAAICVGAQDDQ